MMRSDANQKESCRQQSKGSLRIPCVESLVIPQLLLAKTLLAKQKYSSN